MLGLGLIVTGLGARRGPMVEESGVAMGVKGGSVLNGDGVTGDGGWGIDERNVNWRNGGSSRFAIGLVS